MSSQPDQPWKSSVPIGQYQPPLPGCGARRGAAPASGPLIHGLGRAWRRRGGERGAGRRGHAGRCDAAIRTARATIAVGPYVRCRAVVH